MGRDVPGAQTFLVSANAVTPGYFAVLRTPLLAGRAFTAGDADQAVAIINASLAQQMFPEGGAVGRSLRAEKTFGSAQAVDRVIGVVADAKYANLRLPDPPTIYFPVPAKGCADCALEVRSSLPAVTAERELRSALGPDTQADVTPLVTVMDSGIKAERLLAILAELFGGLALVLGTMGLYGVTAYNAIRRRREFGIRMALGADAKMIAGRVLAEAAAALAVALAAGGLLAWWLVSALQAAWGSLLFGISAHDAGTWAAAAAVLAAAAAVAAWLPARRAGRADPIAALKEE